MPPVSKKSVSTNSNTNGSKLQVYIEGVPLDSPNGKPIKFNPVNYLTFESAQQLVGWETETQYRKRMAEATGTKPDDPKNSLEKFAMTDDKEVLKITGGERFWCRHNARNRPFDLAYTMRFLQDMLNRRWAGTIGLPYDTVNGETCIRGAEGNILSAQKRIPAYILLCYIWHNKSHSLYNRAREMWPEEPRLPVILVFGVSEHPDVVRTLDNVQPRSEMDVVYTSGMFDSIQTVSGLKDNRGQDILRELWPIEKKTLSKMMAKAIDFLWHRTQVSEGLFLQYQTHGETIDFMTRHSTLRKCVLHVFKEDSAKTIYEETTNSKGKEVKQKKTMRGISMLKVSTGECAGLMYLMATSGDSAQKYNMSNREKRNEDMLGFSRYDKAAEFMALLGNPESTVGVAVRGVARPQIGRPANEYGGKVFQSQEGGTRDERMAVIAKAWCFWIQEQEFDSDTLRLGYKCDCDKDGTVTEFKEIESRKIEVGGIDMGESKEDKDKDHGGTTVITDSTEVPEEREVYEGDDEGAEERIAELHQHAIEGNPVEESPAQERARREAVERKGDKGDGEEPSGKVVSRKIKRK